MFADELKEAWDLFEMGGSEVWRLILSVPDDLCKSDSGGTNVIRFSTRYDSVDIIMDWRVCCPGPNGYHDEVFVQARWDNGDKRSAKFLPNEFR